ncbi:MAG: pilus assembly protein N-terminal domain-containing protein [Nitrospira sp.]|nr:pilus assembly protein N-terminal domain-containing protein [Nitrospira sp.]
MLMLAAPSIVAAEWEAQAVERVSVTVGKSVLIAAPAPLARVSVANPQIADALVLTPRQVYLMGKSVGVTNVTLWNTAGEVSVTYDIVVSPDVSRLRDQLQQAFSERDGAADSDVAGACRAERHDDQFGSPDASGRAR